MRRDAFSSASCMTNRAAAVRERYRRPSRAASEATRYARGPFPSASKACGPNPKRFRGSSSPKFPGGRWPEIHHRRVDQRLVQLDAENGIRQLDLADLFILQIANLYGRHNLTPLRVTVHVYSVVNLNLQRLKLALAFLTTTKLPFAPGTAPRTINKLFSASTFATVSPLTVTRASPMWPDERVPLITRDG